MLVFFEVIAVLFQKQEGYPDSGVPQNGGYPAAGGPGPQLPPSSEYGAPSGGGYN